MGKIGFRYKTLTFFFTLFLLFFLTDLVYGGLNYYYLHIGSFRSETKATQFSQDFQKMGLETVVRGEEVADKGFWYRIYLGPFYSRLEAELKSRDLKRKGIVDYAAIHKKDSLLLCNLKERPEQIEKAPEAVPEKKTGEITPPAEEDAPVIKATSPELPPVEKKPDITERSAGKVPSIKEKIATEKASPPLRVKKPGRELYPKPPSKSLKKGYGRNTRQWGLALGLKYSYRDIQTVITKREKINDPNYVLKEDEKDEFPTQMHITTMQLRLGLTNFLEVFGNIGTSFDDPSELGFAYGGGLRINLFEIRGFYSALQGEYLGGDFDEEYLSDEDNKWKKETEWEEINAKVELGFTRHRFVAYIGGTFFHYNEDTKRRQMEGSSSLREYQDEIEEENSYGAYGGISIHLTPAFIANLAGEVLTQKSISVTLEYMF